MSSRLTLVTLLVAAVWLMGATLVAIGVVSLLSDAGGWLALVAGGLVLAFAWSGPSRILNRLLAIFAALHRG